MDVLYRSGLDACAVGRLSAELLRKAFGGKAYHLMGKKENLLFSLGLAKNRGRICLHGGEPAVCLDFRQAEFGPKPGHQWVVPFAEQADRLNLSYELFVPHGFDFNKGGKLPGLAGGQLVTGGVLPTGTNGWSARMMFKEGGKLCFYLYHLDMGGTYGEHFYFQQDGEPYCLPAGQWLQVHHRLQMNQPGQHNGVASAWVNRVQVAHFEGLAFRSTNTLGIDKLLFSCFFGGGSPDWAPRKDCSLLFRNFVAYS